ncbi:hypothetical protein J437_LFUL007268 [Ladona fulva]|uniref:Uncharacterized protein n=1 Tax=Ladona fulva TaxID=123851 RepID=A0A8K0K1G6_LADFU|nr:hypothetical protein J437_LFUL007268 [Ladona fulva]
MPKEKKVGNDSIVMADEALEIPPIVGLPFETIPDVKMTTPPSPEALPKKSSSIEKKATENVTDGLQQRLNDEVLYKPKKKKEKRKKSCTKAPPQSFLDPGGGVSEDSSSPSMSRSEDDASQLVQADAAAVTKETDKSMHSSCPPPGSEGERGSSQSEKGSKVLNLDGKKKEKVERRKKSEVVTSVSLRSSIVEEGHVGGMEAWLPSMPLAPDLRSPTSIRQDVESKGELLAKLLDLKPILPQPMPKIEANSCTERSPLMHSERSFALKVTDGPIVDDSCEAPSLLLETSVKIGEAEMVTRQSIERELLNQRVKTEEEMAEKEAVGRNRAYSLDSDWEVISD